MDYGIRGWTKHFGRKLVDANPLSDGKCPGKSDANSVFSSAEIKIEAKYPDPYMSKKTIQHGGFIFYLIGIMYSFMGISLVTQNYINPAIDTIKKKGILGSDTMNATLLAFSNSAAESFIVMNSIFFGVPDIGI